MTNQTRGWVGPGYTIGDLRIRYIYVDPLLISNSDGSSVPGRIHVGQSDNGANLLLKVGDMKLKVHVERATIKALKLSRLGGKRCKLL